MHGKDIIPAKMSEFTDPPKTEVEGGDRTWHLDFDDDLGPTWLKCIPATLNLLFPSKEKIDRGIPSISNGGILGTEFRIGDRVKIRNKREDQQDRTGRIAIINAQDDIYMEMDEEIDMILPDDKIDRKAKPLTGPIHLDDLVESPPLFGGYMYKFDNESMFGRWEKRYYEVWDDHFSARADEFAFEYDEVVMYDYVSVKVVTVIPGAAYPFGNKLPPGCDHIQSQLTVVSLDEVLHYYISEHENDMEIFRDTVRNAVIKCARSA